MFSYDFNSKNTNIFESNKFPKLHRIVHNFNNPGWVYNYHLHKNATEIVYIADGKAEYTIDMKSFIVEKGQILILEKGVIHSITSDLDNPVDAWTCIIGDYKINANNEDVQILPNKNFHIMSAGIHEEFIQNIFKEIYILCLNDNPFSKSTKQIFLSFLFIKIFLGEKSTQ